MIKKILGWTILIFIIFITFVIEVVKTKDEFKCTWPTAIILTGIGILIVAGIGALLFTSLFWILE